MAPGGLAAREGELHFDRLSAAEKRDTGKEHFDRLSEAGKEGSGEREKKAQ